MTLSHADLAERTPPYDRRAALGRSGEDEAERLLASRGFRILRRRFRTRAGEIDLVAEEGGTLVFIEVKTRSSLACGRPAEAVGRHKQARLRRAAQIYLLETGAHDRPCRFDVVEVLEEASGHLRVGLIRDAF